MKLPIQSLPVTRNAAQMARETTMLAYNNYAVAASACTKVTLRDGRLCLRNLPWLGDICIGVLDIIDVTLAEACVNVCYTPILGIPYGACLTIKVLDKTRYELCSPFCH